MARGPLSSALGQWAFVTMGTVAVIGGDTIKDAATRAVTMAVQLAAGVPLSTIMEAQEREQARKGAKTDAAHPQAPAPIVIHTGGAGSAGGALFGGRPTAVLVQLVAGAGLCWGSYIVLSNVLPDQIKEMLPVTRKFFDAAVTSLGNGILQVKDSLTEQMFGLERKQDELAEQQTETHSEVLTVKNELGEVRFDLSAIADTVERCEANLTDAERRQSYTARGVRLLVRCVGAMMPGNARLSGELERFAELGEEFQDDGVSMDGGGGGGYEMIPPGSASRGGGGPATPMLPRLPAHAAQGHNPMGPPPSAYRGDPVRTPSFVTPRISKDERYGRSSSVRRIDGDTGPEKTGQENAVPPTPQDLDEVKLLLDMVRRGGNLTVS